MKKKRKKKDPTKEIRWEWGMNPVERVHSTPKGNRGHKRKRSGEIFRNYLDEKDVDE